jgi:uncharacterized protein YfaA (DUF2138 family)
LLRTSWLSARSMMSPDGRLSLCKIASRCSTLPGSLFPRNHAAYEALANSGHQPSSAASLGLQRDWRVRSNRWGSWESR